MSAAAALPGVRRHALLAQGISKTFSGVRALRSVDLQIGRGEIHALLGENGSGKSTLIKVLSGYHRPEQGEILVASERMVLGSAQSSYALGCRFVHQELALSIRCRWSTTCSSTQDIRGASVRSANATPGTKLTSSLPWWG